MTCAFPPDTSSARRHRPTSTRWPTSSPPTSSTTVGRSSSTQASCGPSGAGRASTSPATPGSPSMARGSSSGMGRSCSRNRASSRRGAWSIPSDRGLGVGSALLDRIEQRAGGLLAGASSSRFRHAINAGDRAAESMLAARGLRPVRHFWHMQIDLAEPLDPGPPPDGIEIAEIRSPDDLPAIHAVLAEAFADHWGGYPEPSEKLDRGRDGPPDLRPDALAAGDRWRGVGRAPSPRASSASTAGSATSESGHVTGAAASGQRSFVDPSPCSPIEASGR